MAWREPIPPAGKRGGNIVLVKQCNFLSLMVSLAKFLFHFSKQTKLTFLNPYLESRWCPTTRSRAWTSDGTHAEMLSDFVFSSAQRIPVTEAKTQFQLLGAQNPQEGVYVLEIKTSTYRVKQLDVFRKIKPPTGSNHLKKEQKCGQIFGAALFSTRGDFFSVCWAEMWDVRNKKGQIWRVELLTRRAWGLLE